VRTNRARASTLFVLVATVLQLAVAATVSGLPQFEGKGFGARLVFYPALMLLVPAAWWGHFRMRARLGRRSGEAVAATGAVSAAGAAPWAGFALLMTPFLVDVTGNTLDLYDTIWWWDDANHAVNWFMLSLGAGLLLERGDVRPRWALGLLVAGLGAALAIGWELGEWWAFIRHGTELDTAYTDTLGDEAFGTLGAAVAGVVVATRRGTRARWRSPRPLRPGR
jgi:hypothetical protein